MRTTTALKSQIPALNGVGNLSVQIEDTLCEAREFTGLPSIDNGVDFSSLGHSSRMRDIGALDILHHLRLVASEFDEPQITLDNVDARRGPAIADTQGRV